MVVLCGYIGSTSKENDEKLEFETSKNNQEQVSLYRSRALKLTNYYT